jgi:hypothetical protein
MGCGFEQRSDEHPHPAMNAPTKFTRHYIDGNLKNKTLDYQWGVGISLSQSLQRIRRFYQKLKRQIAPLQHRWLDTSLQNTHFKHVGLWLYETPAKPGESPTPKYVFALNSDPHDAVAEVQLDPLDSSSAELPEKKKDITLEPIFSTDYLASTLTVIKGDTKTPLILKRLAPGEGRIYRVRQVSTQQPKGQPE